MCMIIAYENQTVAESLSYIDSNSELLQAILDSKGGDGYSISIITQDGKAFISKIVGGDLDKLMQKFVDEYENQLIENKDKECVTVLFSRQRPEMEEDTTEDLIAPFESNDGSYVWVHGTVANEEEIKQKYGISNIKVDSEIFARIPEDKYDEVKGFVTIFKVSKNKDDKYELKIPRYDLGAYIYHFPNAIVFMTTPEIVIKDYSYAGIPIDNFYGVPEVLFVSYSGGMDVTFSTYFLLKWSKVVKEVHLVYFDYGTKASEQEKERLYRFKDYLTKEFKDIKVTASVIDVSNIFKSLSQITGQDLRLVNGVDDKESEGIKESEANLSYVPFRNTIFVLLLKGLIENMGYKNAGIVLGLNLTEGMVFGDNSHAWLYNIRQLIKFAGKEYQNVPVLAPFVGFTKRRYIQLCSELFGKDKVKELLNISFSCYYPNEDGSPCGKCGSCLLRINALKQAGITE